MLPLFDRVMETSTTTGTGTLTLAGAVSGYQSFAAVGNGNACYYFIQNNSAAEWEVGSGTYTSSGTTLSRSTIIASSNGGSAVSFSAGTKNVGLCVPSNIAWDQTHGGTGGTSAVTGADALHTESTNIASASTTDLSTATGISANITGTTTITALGTSAAGVLRCLTFTGILTLTYNATSLILPTTANITTAAGDTAVMQSLGSGNWRCVSYQRASGVALASSASGLPSATCYILHADGTSTAYNTASNTDAARGTGLRSANAAAVSGDLIVLGAFGFDIGNNAFTLVSGVTLVGQGSSTILTMTSGSQAGVVLINGTNTIMNLTLKDQLGIAAISCGSSATVNLTLRNVICTTTNSGYPGYFGTSGTVTLDIENCQFLCNSASTAQNLVIQSTSTTVTLSTIVSTYFDGVGTNNGGIYHASTHGTVRLIGCLFTRCAIGVWAQNGTVGILEIHSCGFAGNTNDLTISSGATLKAGNSDFITVSNSGTFTYLDTAAIAASLVTLSGVTCRKVADAIHTTGTNIASASTTDLSTATGIAVTVIGTTTITSFGTAQAGALRFVTFAAALTLTYNSSSLLLPTAANVTTAAGDVAILESLGSGNWKCLAYQRADGTPLAGGGSYTADETTLHLASGVFSVKSTYVGQSSITTLGTITTGVWTGTAIAIANGGTGQTSATAAFNALAPSQTSKAGKLLTTDATNTSWSSLSLADMVMFCGVFG